MSKKVKQYRLVLKIVDQIRSGVYPIHLLSNFLIYSDRAINSLKCLNKENEIWEQYIIKKHELWAH